MGATGRLLASGRDADIFEHGPGLVLRRSRSGRSLAAEARIMAYLHDHGFPVPQVHELSEDGCDLVMERVDGPSMVEAIGQQPWTLWAQARVLAGLHQQLHEITPPDFVPRAPVGAGTRLVHLDLHPLNVIRGPRGPVVIDWTAAALGDPYTDVALAWVLMSAGTIPGGGMRARLLGMGRSLLTGAFAAHFDRAEIAARVRPAVEWKVTDPHMSPAEIQTMWEAVTRAEGWTSG